MHALWKQLAIRRSGRGKPLTATGEAIALLADLGYDSDFGARPLRRVIQQKVDDLLSDRVLSGEFADGDAVLVNVNLDGEIAMEREVEGEEAPAL